MAEVEQKPAVSVLETLNRIQKELKAPKGNVNAYGNYRYRSAEDIVEAVKPLLGTAVLTITDDIVLIGERYYVKAIANLSENGTSIGTTAFARESLDKKGMDVAQITGASSSYARKYALNGLFCIDDTKDPDATNKHEKEEDSGKKSKVYKPTKVNGKVVPPTEDEVPFDGDEI